MVPFWVLRKIRQLVFRTIILTTTRIRLIYHADTRTHRTLLNSHTFSWTSKVPKIFRALEAPSCGTEAKIAGYFGTLEVQVAPNGHSIIYFEYAPT